MEVEYKILGILYCAWKDYTLIRRIEMAEKNGIPKNFPSNLLNQQVALCEIIKIKVIEELIEEIIHPSEVVSLEGEDAAVLLNMYFGQ